MENNNKKQLQKKYLKNNDKIEIVHFMGVVNERRYF